jgi:hypothetical protein
MKPLPPAVVFDAARNRLINSLAQIRQEMELIEELFTKVTLMLTDPSVPPPADSGDVLVQFRAAGDNKYYRWVLYKNLASGPKIGLERWESVQIKTKDCWGWHECYAEMDEANEALRNRIAERLTPALCPKPEVDA